MYNDGNPEGPITIKIWSQLASFSMLEKSFKSKVNRKRKVPVYHHIYFSNLIKPFKHECFWCYSLEDVIVKRRHYKNLMTVMHETFTSLKIVFNIFWDIKLNFLYKTGINEIRNENWIEFHIEKLFDRHQIFFHSLILLFIPRTSNMKCNKMNESESLRRSTKLKTIWRWIWIFHFLVVY